MRRNWGGASQRGKERKKIITVSLRYNLVLRSPTSDTQNLGHGARENKKEKASTCAIQNKICEYPFTGAGAYCFRERAGRWGMSTPPAQPQTPSPGGPGLTSGGVDPLLPGKTAFLGRGQGSTLLTCTYHLAEKKDKKKNKKKKNQEN